MPNAASLQRDWVYEVWQDYEAPIIVLGNDGRRKALPATYGMVPQHKIPAGVRKFSTINARSATVGSLRSFCTPWRKGQRCLMPMDRYFKPNWETGKVVRWATGMKDQPQLAVTGLWRAHEGVNGGVSYSHSFTQLTVNADEHPRLACASQLTPMECDVAKDWPGDGIAWPIAFSCVLWPACSCGLWPLYKERSPTTGL